MAFLFFKNITVLKALKSALFIIFLLCAFNSNAQETARFYVFTYPLNAYIEFDGQKIISADSGLTTNPGQHHLKIWLPDYQAVDSNINIEITGQNIFRIYLHLSPDYIAYRKSLDKFKIKKAFSYTPPVLSLLFCGTLGYVCGIIAKNYHNAAQQNELDYKNTQSQYTMDDVKDKFEKNRNNYKLFTAISYGFFGLSALPVVWTVKVAIKNSHKKPPVRPVY